MINIIFSTVLYKTPNDHLERLVESINNLKLELDKTYPENFKIQLLILDNSNRLPEKIVKYFNEKYKFVIRYFASKKNLGYGMGHNKNLLRLKPNKKTWYVALNPDIYFEGKEIINYFKYITSNEGITCSAPLIFLPNGDIQYSAKKNPTFISLLVSRFSFFQKIYILKKYLNNNQNKFKNYKKELIESSFLSGCFLTFPSELYFKIGGFSSKYFLHFEDADIVRRCNKEGITIHCPYGQITHVRGRGSHKSISQQIHLLNSYIKYSKIWGFQFF